MNCCNSLSKFIISQLKSSELSLKQVINTFNLPIIIIKMQSIIIDINICMETILNLSADDVKGCHYKELSTDNYDLAWKVYGLENTLYPVFSLLIGEVNYKDAPNNTANSLMQFKKLAENTANFINREEKNLIPRNHYELLSQLLHQLPGCTFIKDKNYKYIDGNNYLIKSVGGFSHRDELLGKDDYFLTRVIGSRWPESFGDSIRADDRKVIAEGKCISNKLEPAFISNEGQVIVQSAYKLPLLDENKKIIGIYGISLDISSTLDPLKLYDLYLRLYKIKKEGYHNYLKYVLNIDNNHVISSLTISEFNCISRYILGSTSKQIAIEFAISPRTVETNIARAKEKVGCSSKAEMILLFKQHRFFGITNNIQ
jgi:DNA-binding CsgD family transcriptional regulator